MASNHTSNYALNQWEPEDRVLRTDFNEDNAKLDAALKAHDNALALRGNCQIWTTSYVGNGAVGPSSPRSLTFPKQPILAFVIGDGAIMPLMPGFAQTVSISTANTLGVNVSWSGNTASWYGGSAAWVMMNTADATYRVVALMLP